MTAKTIIYGVDIPTPTDIEDQATFNELLEIPVDGMVVKLKANDGVELSTAPWDDTRRYTMVDLTGALEALKNRERGLPV